MIEKGKPKLIQVKKEIWMLYWFSNKPIKTEFGGVPITVAIPPAFAAKAIPSIILSAKFLSPFVKPSLSSINSLMTVETNGLAEEELVEEGDDGGFIIYSDKQIQYLYNPVIGSKISISYFF